MKLRLKVLIYIILSTSIIFILSVGYINFRYWNYTRDMAMQISDLYAKQSATNAQSILNGDLKTVEAIENVFLGYNDIDDSSRVKIYNKILANVLENNPDFLSVWMSWELSAINKQWVFPYGRQRTMAFFDYGNVSFFIDTVDTEGDIPGTTYFLLKSGVENKVLTDPYFFSYTKDTGSTFLEASIAKAIKVGGRFVGVVGIDVTLQRFQIMMKQLKPYENSYIIILSNDGTIVANENEKYQGKKIDKIYPEYNKFGVVKKIKNGEPFSLNVKNHENGEDYVSFYPINISGVSTPWSIGFVVSTSVIVEAIKRNSMILIFLSIFSLFLIATIIWFVLSMIIGPIEKTTKTLESLSKGNIQSYLKIKYHSKDEIGRMAFAVNSLIESLTETQKIAQEIGKGNLHANYKVLGDSDVLGHSLISMRDNLLKAKEEEKNRLMEAQQLSWNQSGITEINEILREKSDSFELLADEIINFLVKYTKSIQGGMYLIENKDNKNLIVLKAAYAFDRKKELTAELEIGEGLVGRAIKERRVVVIDNLPDGYLFVRSGLGDKSPSKLIIVPLIFEDTILGAFELASFDRYQEYVVDFLNQIAVRITSSISVLLKNLETTKLLKESQLQTATFEMKERQFAKQRQKLNEKQKQIEIQGEQYKTSLEAIKYIGTYLVLDNNKKIVDCNEFFLKTFDIKKEEVLKITINDIVVIPQSAVLWMDKFWTDINLGIVRKKQSIYKFNSKEFTFKETYFILKGQNTEDNKIIVIGTD